jgi:Protein of unknown function (DUF2384)
MDTEFVSARKKSEILKGRYMAAQPQPHRVEPVNALDLADKMGVGLETIARAIGADPEAISKNPRDPSKEQELRVVSGLWQDLIVLVGDEKDARLFLTQRRSELKGKRPVDFLDQGKPQVVLNLIGAMREMIP